MAENKSLDRFASFVKHRREFKGLSQHQLGVLVYGDVKDARQRVYQIENKKRNVTIDTIDAYLKALDAEIYFNSKITINEEKT